MEFRPTLSLRWSQFLVPPPATPLQLPRGEPQPFLFPLQRTFQSALLWVTHVCHSFFLTLFPRLLLLPHLIWFQFLSAAFAQFGCFSKHRIPFFSPAQTTKLSLCTATLLLSGVLHRVPLNTREQQISPPCCEKRPAPTHPAQEMPARMVPSAS